MACKLNNWSSVVSLVIIDPHELSCNVCVGTRKGVKLHLVLPYESQIKIVFLNMAQQCQRQSKTHFILGVGVSANPNS